MTEPTDTSEQHGERWTRGPWELSAEDVEEEWLGRTLKAPSAADRNCGEPQVVAVIPDIVDDAEGTAAGDETRANAALFKAAPDLYRELSRAVGWLEFFSDVMPGSRSVEASIEDARAALAAARGQR